MEKYSIKHSHQTVTLKLQWSIEELLQETAQKREKNLIVTLKLTWTTEVKL
jgi:hypothetical protein